ncbi:MAG: carbohydrate binding family 9 domain-containing protein [Bryobacteraceae bacterium]|nr:carbohydrate binding family 9 domain-containing protein [Bryobacteraceae bacterium]
MDGGLNEASWRDAVPIGEFTQREPISGAAPTERTEVRVLYDEHFLYIGIRCFDSRPGSILATQMERDAQLDQDDRVEILVDSFQDGRNAYYFATNPAGALVDGRITESNSPALDWDAVWDLRTQIDDQGWTAEFQIPFQSIGFNRHATTWGFNVSRTLARLREESRWAAFSYDARFYQVALAGSLGKFEGLSQGVGMDVKPYGLTGFTRDVTRTDSFTGELNGGVDVFWRVTSNLLSSTTINTDFAETEVDTRQINLTRFPLFFPEKRDFFLEDAGIFEYAGNDREFIPFFSRQIGLVSGEEAPILVGTKLTGKAGRLDIGLLGVRTRASDVAPAETVAVGRLKTNFWDQSYFGVIFTSGEPTGVTTNSLAGADLRLFTSDFLGRGKNAGFTAYGTKTQTPGLTDRDTAYGFEVSYPNDLVDVSYRWRNIGANYNPSLGFVGRRGVRLQDLSTSFRPRPHFWHIRQMNHQLNYTEYYDTVEHAVESRRIFTAPLNWRFHNGEHLEYNWVPTYERLFKPFEIRPGVIIPPGGYWFHRHRFEFNSAQNKRWMFDMTYWGGTFYSGTSHELRTAALWRKDRHLTTSFELQQYFVDLAEGDFTERLALLRINYAFSPRLTVSNFVQYDTESRNIGLQSRMRWIWRPGNEMYVVFNHAWQENTLDRFEALRTNFRVKVNYTVRF